ncbi:Na+/H+ antiporter NhaA [Kordiimonas pumila]|uniref:Na(+)/H(+) antiporter NhaA n=1 Tax=Kordiimonas pumila TaxID=2161677 RepID=A0ABV7D3I2_9PROT|nr:Na+/H+ antiporter NhaA [Kordiimonas pumila]
MKLNLSADAISGLMLIAATALALILNNSAAAPLYDSLLGMQGTISIGSYGLSKSLLLWINEGLMAIFFLLVGLELKREMVYGSLANPKNIILPGMAAIGGMAIPALIYWAAVAGDVSAMAGWAIPTATDIAFAIGVLAFLSKRVPTELKVFLLTLAILDDLGAVIIIAAFYTDDLSTLSLTLGLAGCAALFLLNRFNVRSVPAYMFIGIIVWVCVLKSGVHATLAGVAVGFAIPACKDQEGHSILEDLEHSLHAPVSLMILPLFALANAGISLTGFSFASLAEGISFGVLTGLAIGKPIGVLAGSLCAIYLFRAALPGTLKLRHIWGAGHLAGIGFTMSLFIGSLAFEAPETNADVRIGVLAASTLSVILGWVVLSWKKPATIT